MKNKFFIFIGRLLINVIVIAITVYVIHRLFELSITNAITGCGFLILIIGLMSIINGRIYPSGIITRSTSAGMSSGMNSIAGNSVIIDVETQKAEMDLDAKYVNHDKKKSFIFKKSSFELIITGIITIIIGSIMFYLN